MVECALVLLGDMAVIPVGHMVLLLADLAIVFVQGGSLRVAHIPFLHFVMDPLVLVLQAVVHLFPARMLLLPLGVCCMGRGAKSGAGGKESGGKQSRLDIHGTPGVVERQATTASRGVMLEHRSAPEMCLAFACTAAAQVAAKCMKVVRHGCQPKRDGCVCPCCGLGVGRVENVVARAPDATNVPKAPVVH